MTQADDLSEIERTWLADGLARLPTRGHFSENLGPMFCSASTPRTCFVQVKPAHCNGMGTVHGGFLSSIADIWMWYEAAARLSGPPGLVTLSLNVDFVGPAGPGSILHSRIDAFHLGPRFCHTQARIQCAERVVASARAIFARIGRQQETSS